MHGVALDQFAPFLVQDCDGYGHAGTQRWRKVAAEIDPRLTLAATSSLAAARHSDIEQRFDPAISES